MQETNETTIFSSFYNERGKKEEVTMGEMRGLIKSKGNKKVIACWVYHRLYDRFLKPFFFEQELMEYPQLKKAFQKQYKHGFAIMANCCLLVETLAAFLNGEDETPKNKNVEAYKTVFKKAKDYENELKCFQDSKLYGAVRCGLLHQGETKERFKIRREGDLLCKDKKIINATRFAIGLKNFIISYKNELADKNAEWDSELWDNCRRKIRFIINKSI